MRVIKYRDAEISMEEYEEGCIKAAKYHNCTVEEYEKTLDDWDFANEKFETALERIRSQQQ